MKIVGSIDQNGLDNKLLQVVGLSATRGPLCAVFLTRV